MNYDVIIYFEVDTTNFNQANELNSIKGSLVI